MTKYWIKNRLLYSILFPLIIGLSIIFVFVNNYINEKIYNYDKTSIVDNTEIDYIIPNPTKEQLGIINELDFMDQSFGYYYTKHNLKVANNNVKEVILLSDDLDNINISMFNEKRLIVESTLKYDNEIYIDYMFMKKYNLNIGDEIEFLSTKLKISSIYETNYYYKDGSVFIPLRGDLKEKIENIYKSYSGAYLKVNDIDSATKYLYNYKPQGRLKDRSEFPTQEAYNIHYNAWKNANYFNEISKFEDKFELNTLKKIDNIYMPMILLLILMIIFNFTMFYRGSERKYFKQKKNKKGILKYYINSNLIENLVLILVLLIGLTIKLNVVDFAYFPRGIFNNLYLMFSICVVINFVVTCSQNFVFYKILKK